MVVSEKTRLQFFIIETLEKVPLVPRKPNIPDIPKHFSLRRAGRRFTDELGTRQAAKEKTPVKLDGKPKPQPGNVLLLQSFEFGV